MYKLLFIFLLSLSLSSCRIKLKPNNQDSRFTSFITGYSAATQSAQAAFRIELASTPDSILRKKLSDSSFCKQLFRAQPQLEGKAWYDGDRSLYFQPSEILVQATAYTVSFDLGKIQSVPKELKHFVFQTQTFQQTLQLNEMGFHPQDEMNMRFYYYRAVLQFADVIDTQLIRKNLKLSWHGEGMPFQIISMSSNQYEVRIDSLERLEKPQVMELQWLSRSLPLNPIAKNEVTLASLSDFTLSNYSITEGEEQYVEVTWSDPLWLSQNVDGLLAMDDQFHQDAAIENNILRIHCKDHLEGIHTLKLFRGIKNVSGYSIPKDTVLTLDFGAVKPKLRLANAGGNVLPNSQGLFMPFDALGVRAVDVRIIKIFENNVQQFLQVNSLDGSDELRRVGKIISEKKIILSADSSANLNHWRRYVLDLDKIFNADPSSIYRIQIRFKKEYTTCDCETTDEPASQEEALVLTDDDVSEEDTEETGQTNFYDETYESWQGFTNNNSPCEEAYYSGMGISKNILASNIGLIYKKTKTAHLVWATDLVTAEPKAGVQIQLFNFQNQLQGQALTDAQGYCTLPATEELFLIKALQGKQRGYLKIKPNLMHNLSKFDIEGVNGESAVSAFIYAERGVWRPGDSIYLHTMVRQQGIRLPENYPVELEVENPQGQIIYQHTYTQNVKFTYPMYFATSPQAITGTYTARVKMGNKVYERNLSIETVKPNRLKIQYPIQDTLCSSWNKKNQLSLQSNWLSGATCKKLKAEVSAQYKPAQLYFNQFKDYHFFDADKDKSWQYQDLYVGSLDSTGHGLIPVSLQQKVNELTQVNLITKVFEPGGDFSIDNHTVYFSPFQHYTGIKIGDESTQTFLLTNTNYPIHIKTIQANQQSDTASNIRVRVYCFTNTYWWQEDEFGYNDFMSRSVKVGILDTTLATTQNGFTIPFTARRSGRYLFVCEDQRTGQTASAYQYFDNIYWEGDASQAPEGASQVILSSNKTSYESGEEVMVKIPNTTEGKALITIEKGNQVIHREWVPTTTGHTDYHFHADGNMSPTIYVHVTLIRKHELTAQRIPLRMYGVLPISVRNPATLLHPVIECAEQMEPLKPFTITVKEQQNKPMVYSLVLVDEGLLDLTHFKTPDAWKVFYAKQKLQVKTWDGFSEVIGAYAGSLKTKLNIGGDASEEEDSYENKANRFKPVVQCLGLFSLQGGVSRHTVTLPSYMGRVRIMVVANNEMAFGSTEKSVVVKQALMVLPTLPSILMLGNKFQMPITIFSNAENIKQVQVEIASNDLIQCSQKMLSVQFNQQGDQVVEVPITVGNKIGLAQVQVRASSGAYHVSETINIDVKADHAYTSESKEYTLASGKNTLLSLASKGLPGSCKTVVTLSSIPSLGLEEKLSYLIQYPHGCVEQTTSAAFPQLYLSDVMDVKDSAVIRSRKHIEAAINRLTLFQTAEGGFSYWPGDATIASYPTCYVADFLMEAEAKGYVISPYVKNRLLSYLQSQSNAAISNNEYVAAYQLYDLAKWKKPNLGAMNRLKEAGLSTDMGRIYLAKAYAACGQTKTAQSLLTPVQLLYKQLQADYFQSSFTNQIEYFDALVAVNAPNVEVQMQSLLKSSHQMTSMNTKECAGFLKSMSQYFSHKGMQQLNLRYQVQGKWFEVNTQSKLIQIPLNGTDIRIDNSGSPLFVQTVQRFIPVEESPLQPQKFIGLSVTYKNPQQQVIDIHQLVQGSDVFVEAQIENKQTISVKHLAYRFMLPSGWQFVRTLEDTEHESEGTFTRQNDFVFFHYFDLKPGEKKRIKFLVNATFAGRFNLPRPRVECMYQAAVSAEVQGGVVQINQN